MAVVVDEICLMREVEKLLKEIRLEIKYAESSINYCNGIPPSPVSKTFPLSPLQGDVEDGPRRRDIEGSATNTLSSQAESIEQGQEEEDPLHNKSKHVKKPVSSWSDCFENVLGDPEGLECFSEFLRKEFSEENIQFWQTCNKFKKSSLDDQKIKVEADKIFAKYLARDAPSLVNVNQSAVENLEKKLDKPNKEIFDVPQNQVFHLMKFDSYKRFLQSETYKKVLEVENGDVGVDKEQKAMDLSNNVLNSKENHQVDWKKQMMSFLSNKGKKPNVKDLRKEFLTLEPKHNENSGDLINWMKEPQLWDGLQTNYKSNFLRVIFPDGTSTITAVENGLTLKESLTDLCQSRKLLLSTFDVTTGCPRKLAVLDEEVSKLKDSVIFLEKRTLFRFELPNGRSVGIKANPSKSCFQVLEPVMKKNGFDIGDYSIHFWGDKIIIPLHSKIYVADNKRLCARKHRRKIEREASDSQLFTKKPFESTTRSSFRRFRSSSVNNKVEEKEPQQHSTHKTTFGSEVKQMFKKNKGKPAEEDALALMEALQRSNDDRFNNQRGHLLPSDLELPDFLKDTSSSTTTNTVKHASTSTTTTTPSPRHDTSSEISLKNSYELESTNTLSTCVNGVNSGHPLPPKLIDKPPSSS